MVQLKISWIHILFIIIGL